MIRTVRNGKVLVGGRLFRVDDHHKPYDGRLDGKHFLFVEVPFCQPPMLTMCGELKALNHQPYDGADLVDGTFPWGYWKLMYFGR